MRKFYCIILSMLFLAGTMSMEAAKKGKPVEPATTPELTLNVGSIKTLAELGIPTNATIEDISATSKDFIKISDDAKGIEGRISSDGTAYPTTISYTIPKTGKGKGKGATTGSITYNITVTGAEEEGEGESKKEEEKTAVKPLPDEITLYPGQLSETYVADYAISEVNPKVADGIDYKLTNENKNITFTANKNVTEDTSVTFELSRAVKKITGKGKGKKETITNEVFATIKVLLKVLPPIIENIALEVGKTEKISRTDTGWELESNSDTDIVKAEVIGTRELSITGAKAGTATVICKNSKTQQTATYEVTVKTPDITKQWVDNGTHLPYLEVNQTSRMCLPAGSYEKTPTPTKNPNIAVLFYSGDGTLNKSGACWEIAGKSVGTTSFETSKGNQKTIYNVEVKSETTANVTLKQGQVEKVRLGGSWATKFWTKIDNTDSNVVEAIADKKATGNDANNLYCILKGLKEGTATVTISSPDYEEYLGPNFKKVITVNVTADKIEEVKADREHTTYDTPLSIEVGQSQRLCPPYIDKTITSIAYDNNPAIAAIRHDGDACCRMIGVKVGTTTVSFFNKDKENKKKVTATINVIPAKEVTLNVPMGTPTDYNLGGGYGAWKDVKVKQGGEQFVKAELKKVNAGINNCVITPIAPSGDKYITITAYSTETEPDVTKQIKIKVVGELKPVVKDVTVEVGKTIRVCPRGGYPPVYTQPDKNIALGVWDQGSCYDIFGIKPGKTLINYAFKKDGSIVEIQEFSITVTPNTDPNDKDKITIEKDKTVDIKLGSAYHPGVWNNAETTNENVANATLKRISGSNTATINAIGTGTATITISSTGGQNNAKDVKKVIVVTVPGAATPVAKDLTKTVEVATPEMPITLVTPPATSITQAEPAEATPPATKPAETTSTTPPAKSKKKPAAPQLSVPKKKK